MDSVEQLVFDSEFAVGVLGRAGQFALIRLDGGPIDAALEAAKAKGYYYVGALAVIDGRPVARCEPGLDAIRSMAAATLDFAFLVADRLRARPKSDGADFCKRLYELADTRD